MGITELQFAAWLRTAAPRVVLCELKFAYESGGAPAEGTLYFSDRKFVSRPTDSPPAVRYQAVMEGAPKFRREIDKATLGGRATLSIADLALTNIDGALDFLLGLALDGHEARFYLGGDGWARSDFRLAFVAVAERVVATEAEIIVKLRDKRLLLNRAVQGNPVGGTGAFSTSYLPLLWGSHSNVSAIIHDAAALTYGVVSNYDAASIAIAVRDSGVSLRSGGWSATAANTTVDAGTDTFTKTGHGLAVNDVIFFADPVIAGGTYLYWAPFPGMTARAYWVKTVPSADTFTLSATKGGATLDVTGTAWSDSGSGVLVVVRQRFFDDLANTGRIQLSSTPSGTITVDVLNAATFNASPFAFAKYLVDTFGGLDAAGVDAAAFSAADTTLDAKISLGYTNYSVMDRANLLDILDALLDSVFGWYGQDAGDKITCGLMDVSGISTAPADFTLTDADLLNPGMTVENAAATTSRANVESGINHTIQADGLAASVSEEMKRRLALRYGGVQRSTAPSGTAYATNKPAYHLTMVEGAPRPAAEMSSGAYGTDVVLPLENYADEIVADLAPWRQFISVACLLDMYDVELGDVAEITYPRFGMNAGVKARVIAIEVDLTAGEVRLDLVRHAPPDVTTASYH
ncbi:MAG: hypothetical protein IPM64_17585 [Phycisphaerales bacterium]|nr:hypothetical protein [Phycisphaerales bacterium]